MELPPGRGGGRVRRDRGVPDGGVRRHRDRACVPPAQRAWRLRPDGDGAPRQRPPRRAVDRGARGGARRRQPARRPRPAPDRSADREDGGGHDRPVRALRRNDGDLSRRLRLARTGLRGVGAHLGRQRASERAAARLRRRRARHGGHPLLRRAKSRASAAVRSRSTASAAAPSSRRCCADSMATPGSRRCARSSAPSIPSGSWRRA